MQPNRCEPLHLPDGVLEVSSHPLASPSHPYRDSQTTAFSPPMSPSDRGQKPARHRPAARAIGVLTLACLHERPHPDRRHIAAALGAAAPPQEPGASSCIPWPQNGPGE